MALGSLPPLSWVFLHWKSSGEAGCCFMLASFLRNSVSIMCLPQYQTHSCFTVCCTCLFVHLAKDLHLCLFIMMDGVIKTGIAVCDLLIQVKYSSNARNAITLSVLRPKEIVISLHWSVYLFIAWFLKRFLNLFQLQTGCWEDIVKIFDNTQSTNSMEAKYILPLKASCFARTQRLLFLVLGTAAALLFRASECGARAPDLK